jgi:hypothetical protein
MAVKPYAYSLTIRRLALAVYARSGLPCAFPKRTEEEATRIAQRIYFRSTKIETRRN